MNRLGRLLVLVVGALLLPLAVAKEGVSDDDKVDRLMVTNIDAWIVIDENGHTADFGIDTKVPDQVRTGLDRAARRWKFEPVVIDGAVRRARTAVRITLAAHGDDRSGYRVSVDNVLFPANAKPDKDAMVKEPLTAKKLSPPRYPAALQRAGVSGRVLVALRVNPDGSVAEAQVVQSSLFDVRANDKVSAKAMRLLEEASLDAARRWMLSVNLDPSKQTPGEMTATVPITYIMAEAPAAAQNGLWRQEIRGTKRGIGWLPADPKAQTAGSSDLRDGEMYPVASQFRFVEDVRGQAL